MFLPKKFYTMTKKKTKMQKKKFNPILKKPATLILEKKKGPDFKKKGKKKSYPATQVAVQLASKLLDSPIYKRRVLLHKLGDRGGREKTHGRNRRGRTTHTEERIY